MGSLHNNGSIHQENIRSLRFIVVITSQYRQILNHGAVNPKLMLYVHYISIIIKKKNSKTAPNKTDSTYSSTESQKEMDFSGRVFQTKARLSAGREISVKIII